MGTNYNKKILHHFIQQIWKNKKEINNNRFRRQNVK